MPKKPSLAEQLGARRQPPSQQPIEPVKPENPVAALAATLKPDQEEDQQEETAPEEEAPAPGSQQRARKDQPPVPTEAVGPPERKQHRRSTSGRGNVITRELPGGLDIDTLYRKLQVRKHLSSYTFRFRPEELDELGAIFEELDQREQGKMSRNDIARLGLLWLCEDYRQNGEESVLEQMLRRM
jgi:hypothetical protein